MLVCQNSSWMAHTAEQECDACDELKRISREAGAMQWGQRTKPKSNASSSLPSAQTSVPRSKPAATHVTNDTLKSDSRLGADSVAVASPPHSEDDAYYKGGFWERQSPPGLVELGQAGWTLLHTMAAYYPEEADDTKQAVTHQFLRSFGKVFPCTECARDFQRIISDHPPQLRRRQDFVQWLCEAHNDVNQQLGKPAFPCSEAMARWRSPKASK